MSSISVVICTHDPDRERLNASIASLKAQTLGHDEWELLLVDNASRPPVADWLQLDWHAHSRIVREGTLGLTPARLRGIAETNGDLVVFVDDDNVLESDYLAEALRLAKQWPMLGAWGGLISPVFETAPPDWSRPFWRMLAIREFTSDTWSNLPGADTCGAGLCVRRGVAEAYRRSVTQDPVRMGLDRRGQQLLSCGDSDLALTSLDLGMGTGLFRCLRVKHLIPSWRLSEDYLLRLVESTTYSRIMLMATRGEVPNAPKTSGWRRSLGAIRRLLTMAPRERRFLEARMRGWERGAREAASSFKPRT